MAPSRWIGISDRGEQSLGVRQWISLVLGIEKDRPRPEALCFSFLYLACKSWMLRLCEGEETVRAKSSMKEKVLERRRPLWRGATYRTKRRGEIGEP